MVAIPTIPEQLSDRDNGVPPPQGVWGPIQIAAPAIVGGVLLLLLLAVYIWRRRPVREHFYDYHQVRATWITKIERFFVSRRTRRRVLHLSAPVTIDNSMCMPTTASSHRGSRQYRHHSSDSQTPLASESYALDSPLQSISKRRGLRWWWLFGSRPKEIKSAEPGSRWRIDGPDGSSTGHGHSNHGHEDYHARYVGVLAAMPEDVVEADDGIICIGESLTSVASMPMTQHIPEQVRPVHGMETVQEHPGLFVTRTPVSANTPLQNNSGTPVSSANHGLPPSYEVSQSLARLTQYQSAEEVARLARPGPYMPAIIPPPSRAAMYSPSPRGFHGRHLSSDSFLAAQPPMAVAMSSY